MQLMDWLVLSSAISLIALVVMGLFWAKDRRELRDLQAISPAARAIRKKDKKKDKPNFSALASATPDAFLVVDADRRVIFANPPATQLWPGTFAPRVLLIELSRSYELDAIAADALTEKYAAPREITLNGRLFRVLAAYDAKRDTATLILRDVSELQRLGRARRDFVANLSHELRTPLTAIRLLIETASPSFRDGQRVSQDWLDKLHAQADTLTQISQEMYDLSQIESGRLPMRMVPVNLDEVAAGVVERLAPQAQRAELTLTNQIPSATPALADPEQLGRALSNLVHNAIKFTRTGGVTIFLPDRAALKHEVAEDYLVLAVTDTGAGIPKEEHIRIFERFYKADRARGSAGTGLGLAIVKHIIEAHGGQVWIDSTEGKGATFYLSVPKV